MILTFNHRDALEHVKCDKLSQEIAYSKELEEASAVPIELKL